MKIRKFIMAFAIIGAVSFSAQATNNDNVETEVTNIIDIEDQTKTEVDKRKLGPRPSQER